jgi:hypothetical protein
MQCIFYHFINSPRSSTITFLFLQYFQYFNHSYFCNFNYSKGLGTNEKLLHLIFLLICLVFVTIIDKSVKFFLSKFLKLVFRTSRIISIMLNVHFFVVFHSLSLLFKMRLHNIVFLMIYA